MIKANRKGVDCVHDAECNNVVFFMLNLEIICCFLWWKWIFFKAEFRD